MMIKWTNGVKKVDNKTNKLRNKIQKTFFSILEKNAFEEVTLPVLDYADSYILNNEFSTSQNHFKSIAPNGEVLSLPTDLIAGLLSFAKNDISSELKLCGAMEEFSFLPAENEDVNRYSIGAIIYGKSGEEAECDMIITAYEFAKKIGVSEPEVIISNTNIFQGILNTFAQHKESRERLVRILNGKIENDIDYASAQLLNTLKNVEGSGQIIQDLAQKIDNQESIDGLLNLFEIHTIFEAYNIGIKITIKPAYLGERNYDNGLVFKVVDGNGNTIIYGGRCDSVKGKDSLKCIYSQINILNALNACSEKVLNNLSKFVIIAVAPSRVAMSTAIKLRQDCISENLIVDTIYNAKEQDLVGLVKANPAKAVLFIDENGDIKHN